MHAAREKSRSTSARHIVWIGIGVIALYWILESAVDVVIFQRGNLVGQLFAPGAHELWQRLLVACVISAFSIYAYFSTAARKRMEQAQEEKQETTQKYLDMAGVMLLCNGRKRHSG